MNKLCDIFMIMMFRIDFETIPMRLFIKTKARDLIRNSFIS